MPQGSPAPVRPMASKAPGAAVRSFTGKGSLHQRQSLSSTASPHALVLRTEYGPQSISVLRERATCRQALAASQSGRATAETLEVRGAGNVVVPKGPARGVVWCEEHPWRTLQGGPSRAAPRRRPRT